MSKLTSLTQEEMDNVIYDARFGDLDSLKAIFTDEVEPSVLPKIKDGMTKATPFHMAAANGHADVLKYLIKLLDPKETKSILNQQNDSGNTALHGQHIMDIWNVSNFLVMPVRTLLYRIISSMIRFLRHKTANTMI